VTLTNTSDVPLTFHAHVPHDGSGLAVCFDRLTTVDSESDDNAVPNELDAEPGSDEERPTDAETADVKPREFTVQPSSGVLEPSSDVTFTVTLCPSTISKYSRELAVTFDQVADETFTVPITAQYADGIHLIDCCSRVNL